MSQELEWRASDAVTPVRAKRAGWMVAAGFALTLLLVAGALLLVWRESSMAIDAVFLGLTAVASSGLCVAYTLVMRYMRQRDEAETALRDLHRSAQEANRLRNDFIARVSYDIRGPLTAILGYCDLPLESGADARSRLAAIRENASHIAAAVNEILSVPRQAGGSADLRPAVSRGAGEPSAAPQAARPFHGRVLLAEDSHDLQQVITFYLRETGAEVTVVCDGQLAYDQAMAAWTKGEAFDLILMDMQMPAADGRAATIRLRNARYTHPIVALTANVTEKAREECLAAGCNGFLAKPVDQGEFFAVLARYLHTAAGGQPEAVSAAPDLTEHPQFVALRELFRVEIPSRVAEIGQALSAGDIAGVANLAHRLKGTAGCYGLAAIGDAAAALQAAAERAEGPEALRGCLETLREQCGQGATVKAA